MGVVAKEVKAMSTDDILAFEKAGEINIATFSLKLSDIKVCSWVGKVAMTFLLFECEILH